MSSGLLPFRSKKPYNMAEYFKKIPYKQDLPPPGGYKKIVYESNLPKRGASGVVMLAGTAAVMAFGFYFVAKGNQERRQLKTEKTIARLSLVPLLQAESDRLVLRRMKENSEIEKLVMKDVKGWKPKKAYNTDRWVPPRNFELVDYSE